MADTDAPVDQGASASPAPPAFDPSLPFVAAPASAAPPPFDPSKPHQVLAAPAFDASKPSAPAEPEPLHLVPGQTTQDDIDAARTAGRPILVPGETEPRKPPPPEQTKPEEVVAQQGWDLSGYPAPPKPPGWIGTAVEAGRKGLVSGLTESAQAATPFRDRPAEQPDTSYVGNLLTQPISQGWSNPKWWIAHIAHGTAESSPSLALGIAGGVAGAAVPGGGETGLTELGGAAAGFGIGSAIQTIAPAYQRARQEGLDHDAAVDRAIKETGVSTAFGTLMGIAPAGVGAAIKGPLSRALAEIFVAQPALGAAQQVTTGAVEGKMPTADELATGYAENVGMGAGLAGAHEAGRRLLGAEQTQPAATQAAQPAAPSSAAAPTPPAAPADVAARALELADRLDAAGDSDAAARLRAQYGQPAPQPQAQQLALPKPETTYGEGFTMQPAAPEPTPATPLALPAPDVVYGPQGWEQRGGGLVPAQGFTMERQPSQPTALDQLKETAAAISNDARTRQQQAPAAVDQQLAGAERQLQQEAQPTRQPVGQQLIQGLVAPVENPQLAQTGAPAQQPERIGINGPETRPSAPPEMPAIPPQTAEMSAPSAPPSGGAPVALQGPNFRHIRDDQAVIPSTGASFPVSYAIADAHDLQTSNHDDLSPNPNYPQALQPRSRERAETEAQLASILNGGSEGQFQPSLLGENPDAANGAPIVGPDGLVEGGNARTMAIRRAYDRGLPQAEEYRNFLASQSYPVEGMAAPMLVRVNRAGMDMPQREQLARDLNVPPQAAMSPSDQAMADSAQIPPQQLRSYQGGDVFSAQNQPFLLGLLRNFVRPNELPALLNPDGGLSPAGRTRVRNALLAKAYGDSNLVSTLTEDADNSIKAIGAALIDSAPAWAQLRDAVARGEVPERFDLTSPLIEAVRLVSHARDTGRNVAEFVNQRGMFGEGVSPETEDILGWFLGAPDFTRRFSQGKMADAVSQYAFNAMRQRPDLLGGEARQPLDLVEQARQSAQGAAGDLFAAPVATSRRPGSIREIPGGDGAEAQRPGSPEAGMEPPAGGAQPAAEPAGQPQPAAEARPEVAPEPAPGEGQAARVIPNKHTQTGEDLFTVQLGQRVGGDEFKALGARARQMGGRYSAYRGRGAVPGFIFKDAESARRFADSVNGAPAERPATSSEAAPPPAGEPIAPAAATEPASAQASGEGKTAGLPAEEPTGASPAIRLADRVSREIAEKQGEGSISPRELQGWAEDAFGGKLADNAFGRDQMYDAAELGVNRYIREHPDSLDINGNIMRARVAIERLNRIKDMMPTQTVRAGEKETHQQFSTPPDYAYAAVRAAAIRPDDRVMEPSAGTGSLVAHAMNAHPAEMITNEISQERAPLVESLGPTRSFRENAEQLDNILPNDVRPSVVVMNPPFSATAGRMGDRRVIMAGAQHVEQALNRLEPGGRLVAIVGRGMSPDAPTFRPFWNRIGTQYDVRANIGVSGDVYRKYGTNFGTRLLVIDKIPPSGRAVVTGDVGNTYDLVNRLEDIRNDRPTGSAGQQVAGQPSRPPLAPSGEGQPGPAAALPRPTPAPGVRAGAADTGAGRPVQGELGIGGGKAAEQPTRPGEGNAPLPGQPERGQPGRAEPEPARAAADSPELGTGGAAPNGNLVRPERGDESVLSVSGERASLTPAVRVQEAAADPATGGEITENVYESYRPQRITIEGAKPHPGELVQSAAMASVMPPRIDYAPQFDRGFVEKGLLSDAQLEAVTYAGHAHSQMLPALEDQPQIRRGYFIGDGTGVGKGREVSGIILDNWNQGRQKHLWVSEKRPLISDARRDWSGLGQDQKHIFDVSKTKAGDKIGASKGIAFTTYDTLRGGEKQTTTAGRNYIPKTRIDQLVDWLGKDFDGVIAFDECVPTGTMISTPYGQVAIERLKIGDIILGFDHAANRIVEALVQWTFQRRTQSRMYEVGPVTMTGNHPVWTAEDDYIPASEVEPGNTLRYISQHGKCTHLRKLRNRVRDQKAAAEQPESLLRSTLLDSASAKDAGAGARPNERCAEDRGGSSRQRAFGRAPSETKLSGWPARLSEFRTQSVQEYRGEQAPGRDSDATSRRKWEALAAGASNPARSTWVGGRISDWCVSFAARLYAMLPGGHRGTEIDDCGRGGWFQPQVCYAEGAGCEENGLSARARMDGASLLEFSGAKEPEECRCRDRGGDGIEVFNIETTTGNYFANGVLVHNCHNLGNALAQKGGRGVKDASQKALAGIELQKRLPNARVVYVSATGATEVSNLAYADRLGLWGHGTAFADKKDFIGKIANGGVAAMELVARDMKAMGSYISRNLSYDGVEYDRLQHTLQPHDREMYDKLAEAWQITLRNFEKALEVTGASKNGNAKSAASSAFWGSHQRFFNQILTSLQMPTIIKSIERDLAEGRQAVVQLVNTNEASLDRALAKKNPEEDLEDLDLSPKDQLMQLIEHTFPTQKYEDYLDESGNVRSRPVVDSDDNPVQDKEAIAMRERLLDQLGAISAPDGPLEMLHNHFGVDNVAEVTGRKQRVVNRPDENGVLRKVRESRPASANETEGNAFQAGKKKVLVFSSAGGTGRSYHADNSSPSAGARRSHYLAQPGWRADTAIQGFGRTHRTNQASAPQFHLVTTDLQGQRRFISSIARRLAQLGALTKGERRTGDQGLFNARDNLESPEARDALYRFFRDLHNGQIEGMHTADFERETGLKLRTPEGSLRRDLPDIPQFLNRLLSMKIDPQNRTFNEFDSRLSDAIENAAARGTLDTGLETLKADRLTKQHESVVYTDPKSGAETKYVRLSQENRNQPRSFDDVTRRSLDPTRDTKFFVKSIRTGKTYAVSDTSAYTDTKTGKVNDQYKLTHPLGYDYTDRYKIDGYDSRKYWQRIDDPAEARAAWEASVAKIPEFNKQDLHLITGAVLPIWDRLSGQPRVYRLQTTDTGERLLGRQIPNDSVAATLERLGAGQEGRTFAPADVVSQVLDGEQAKLANGWSIIRSFVAGQPRIEVRGPSFPDMQRMQQTGLFNERIAYNTRFFIPTGENAENVMKRLIDQHPVVSLGGGAGDVEMHEPAPAGWGSVDTSVEQPPRAPSRDMTDQFQAFHGTGDYPQTSLGYHTAAQDWTRLRGRATDHEHLVAYDDDEGRVTYAGTNGSRSFVGLPESALEAGSNLIIHHNHPGNGGLSTDDLAALSYPGVSRIIAHAQDGADGHLFSAELTPAAKEWLGELADVDQQDAYKALRRSVGAAAQPIREALESTARSGQLSHEDAARIGHDLLGRALDAAGIVHYVSSRSYEPLSPTVAKNIIASGATAARLLAGFRLGAAEPRFVPHEDLTNAVLDRSASVVGPDEAMARAFGPTQDIASGRYLGGELGGGRGAGVGEAGEGGAGRPLVAGLREETELPATAEGHEAAGHQALQNGQMDEAMRHFSAASRLRADDQGGTGQPPAPPPPGGTPPQGPMTPEERKSALDRIMHTDDPRWLDQAKAAVKSLRDQPGLRFRQYWQDNLAALETAEKSAYGGGLAPGRISPTISARFARNWQSTLDIALNHSQVRYNPDTGVIEPIQGSKSFRDILKPLADDEKASGRKTTDDFALWSIVQRAERLKAEGRERNVPQDIIDRARDLDREYQRPDGSNLFEDVHRELQGWHSRLLDLGEAAGLINPDSRALWEHNDYVPFYRALGDDEKGAPTSGTRGIVNARSPIRQLLGGGQKVNNIYENMIMNASAMVRRSMANIAGQKAWSLLTEHTDAVQVMSKEARAVFGDPVVQESLRAAGIDPDQMTAEAKQGAADLFGALKRRDPDVMSVMFNGKPVYGRVKDPLLLQSVTAAGPATMNGLGRLLTAPARLLRGAVVFDPAFMLAHNLRMAQHAFILTGTNPVASITSAIRQAKGIDPIAMKLMASGAMSGKYDLDLPRNVRRQIASPEYQATLIDTPLKAARMISQLAEHAMQASDVGPRIAVYQNAMKGGMNEADALDRARDLLDFSTHGAGGLAMFLAQTIPFLNARWQGMARTYRGLTGSDRNGLMMRGALVTAATLALYYQNKDDPEYQRKEDWDRQYAWQIKVGDLWFRLPKPFELGALFGTVPEIIADYFDNGSTRTMANATGAMFSNVFKFNPIPVAIRPALEVWWNHDSFTGQPIVNEREAALTPDLQYGPADSQSVVQLTQAFNSVSPVKVAPANVQHLLRGYLAGWGTYITAASDYLGEQAGILPATPSPAETPVAGRFVHTEPEPSNRLMTDFYDLKNALSATGQSIREAQKNQENGMIQTLQGRHPEYSRALEKDFNRVGSELAKIRGVYQRTQMNPSMGADQKTTARDNYYRQRDRLLDSIKPLLRQAEGLPAQP